MKGVQNDIFKFGVERELTISQPSTTNVLYANNLDPDETPSSSRSKLFDTQITFSPILSDIEAL